MAPIREEPAYQERRPAPALAPFVRCYWQLRTVVPARSLSQRILPDGCADVLFELGAGSEPRARWVGTMTRAIIVVRDETVDTFGVRFNPGGLHALAGLPLHVLTDAAVGLEELDLLGLEAVREQLAGAARMATRARLLDRVLLRALSGVSVLPAVSRIVAAIDRLEDVPTVRTLASHTGWTARTLERRFLDALGITPKQHLRFVRFERARRLLLRGDLDGAAIAAETGYADQAHFIHEFHRFAGASPQELVRERVAI